MFGGAGKRADASRDPVPNRKGANNPVVNGHSGAMREGFPEYRPRAGGGEGSSVFRVGATPDSQRGAPPNGERREGRQCGVWYFLWGADHLLLTTD